MAENRRKPRSGSTCESASMASSGSPTLSAISASRVYPSTEPGVSRARSRAARTRPAGRPGGWPGDHPRWRSRWGSAARAGPRCRARWNRPPATRLGATGRRPPSGAAPCRCCRSRSRASSVGTDPPCRPARNSPRRGWSRRTPGTRAAVPGLPTCRCSWYPRRWPPWPRFARRGSESRCPITTAALTGSSARVNLSPTPGDLDLEPKAVAFPVVAARDDQTGPGLLRDSHRHLGRPEQPWDLGHHLGGEPGCPRIDHLELAGLGQASGDPVGRHVAHRREGRIAGPVLERGDDD